MIKVRDLWKAYGKLEVLRGLNLDIEDGETLVILGRSGAGKSVLLKQIIGIEAPDKGYVEVDGMQISKMTMEQRRHFPKKMGMLFQGAALFDSMTIGENTAFYLRQHLEEGATEAQIQERVDRALKMVGLEGVKNKMPSELSGGMKKRAGLARVIVYNPRIILYDEPTTGLDPITSMQINELINLTKKELKATSVVVTHDILSALTVGTRLAFSHDGAILHVAPKKEFMKIKDPLLEQFFENAIVTPEVISKSLFSN